MPSRLADLIRKARRLATERDRLVDAVASEWVSALRGQRLSRTDLDELWAALTEEALRRSAQTFGTTWSPATVRQETEEVIARVRAKVEAALHDG